MIVAQLDEIIIESGILGRTRNIYRRTVFGNSWQQDINRTPFLLVFSLFFLNQSLLQCLLSRINDYSLTKIRIDLKKSLIKDWESLSENYR